MATPTRGASTTENKISIDWLALTSPSNGDATILSYHLQWDSGTSAATWTDLIGLSPASLATNLVISTNVVSGNSYKFRVRAQNVIGWGSYSTSGTIKAAVPPYQMATATTSIDSASGGVKIQWVVS
jgi:hypothetical protein